MAIDLKKGQRIDLTKGNPGLDEILVGLGWDPVKENAKGGFLGSFFGGGKTNIDCDASVLLLNEEGSLGGDINNLVYFGNLTSSCGGISHLGDNLTGDGDGDDEQIIVQLKKVSPQIHKLIFVVNIYQAVQRKQDFGMIANAFIRIVDKKSNQEIAKYNLTDDYKGKTALIVGEVYRHQDDWKFAAIGEGTNDTSLSDVVKRY